MVTHAMRLAYMDSQPRDELGPANLVIGSFELEGVGHKVANYFWPASKPAKGVVILVHGHASNLCYEYLKLNVCCKRSEDGGWQPWVGSQLLDAQETCP